MIVANKSELAAVYGASRTAVANWSRRGLPQNDDGGFDTDEVDEFLASIGSPKAPKVNSLRERFLDHERFGFHFHRDIGQALLRTLPKSSLALKCGTYDAHGDPTPTVRELLQAICPSDKTIETSIEIHANELGLPDD